MTALTAPGVYVQFVQPPAELNPVAVDVPAFLGVFQRGPVDTPTRVASWPQFQAIFGDFVLNGIGAYALKGWLDNGGRVAWVVRVAAPERVGMPAGPQPADRASSILTATDGFVVGAGAAVEQNASAWLYLVTAVDSVAGRVTWDRPLHPDLDLTQPFTVSTGACAAATTLSEASGTPVLTISANGPGVWGNGLSVLAEARFEAATSSRVIPSPTAAATAVQSCDGFTAGSLALLTQVSGASLLSERRIIAAVDPAGPVLQWDAPLSVVDPAAPIRIESDSFALSVSLNGELQEVHDHLSVVATSGRYVVDVLALESALLSAAVPAASPPPPASDNPAPAGWVILAGGLDGTAALSTADLLGNEPAGDMRGLASLTPVDEPAIVCAPDLVAQPVMASITVPPVPAPADPCPPCPPPPAPPALTVASVTEASADFSLDEIAAAQQALIDDCEARGDRIALLDPPCGQGALSVPSLVSWRARFSSSYGAMYAPWVLVIDPLGSTEGQAPPPWGALRRLPPSGHVAGLIAQIDADAGPWQSPANQLLQWAHQTDMALDDTAHGTLNSNNVDALRALAAHGVAVLGARTLSTDTSWMFLAVRRLFLLLERTFRVGLAWTAFEPAGPPLESTMAASITGLLTNLFDAGAFGGSDPQSSFFVQTGGGDPLLGQAIVQIGILPAPPAEVILLQVMRTENQLELQVQPQQGATT